MLLLTACVSVESTKRYIWETIATKHSRTSHGHVSSLFKILVKEKQRFMNVLFKKYSTMTQEKVFSDTFSTTALAVYDEFESAEALANMDLHELTDFIIEKGKNRFPDPDAVAKAIQKAARSSYRLPKTVNDSVNQVLSISITSMKALESQIKEFDKAIKAQMELLPNVLISIPGIGPVYSAGIMAEIGDINRFNSQAALAKYAGLAWKQHQSGGFEVRSYTAHSIRQPIFKVLSV